MELKSVQCRSCSKSFKVLKSSNQIYCSKLCGDEKKWVGQGLGEKREKLKIANASAAATLRQSFVKSSLKKEGSKTSMKSKKPSENKKLPAIIEPISSPETGLVVSGHRTIASESEPIDAIGTSEIEVLRREQSEALWNSRLSSLKAASESLSLLNESSRNLINLMRECVNEWKRKCLDAWEEIEEHDLRSGE